jgi:hypothetical protein
VTGCLVNLIDAIKLAYQVFELYIASESESPNVCSGNLIDTVGVITDGAREGLKVIRVIILFDCFDLVVELVPYHEHCVDSKDRHM